MPKLTKDIEKKLREAAKSLPADTYEITTIEKISAEELKLTPYAEKQKLEPGAVYELPTPLIIEMNHYRRLKRRYVKGGMVEVVRYIAQYVKK